MPRFRLRQPSPLDPRRSLPDGLSYYVITTASKREFNVARWLEAECDAFTIVPLVYRPLSPRWRGVKYAIKMGKAEMPLIPRIVVAGMELPPSAGVLSEVNRHITGVLGINGEPMPLRTGEPERLLEISAALMKPVPIYKSGDKVKMPMAGYGSAGVVEVSSVRGRWAHVIQSWFGIEREVRVPLENLEAA